MVRDDRLRRRCASAHVVVFFLLGGFALGQEPPKPAEPVEKPAEKPLGDQAPPEEKKPIPTFSIEAVAINSVPLAKGPVRDLTIAPGNRVKAEMFVRDFSPNGQQMRAYQVEIDASSYGSGESGTVRPMGFDEARQPGVDSPHAYIDKRDPRFVHRHLDAITIADSHQPPSYRWLNVLIELYEGPVSPQDGTKYYLGTLDLEASKDAKGAFTIKFVEGQENSGLRDPDNQPILPVAYEPLTIRVEPGSGKLVLRGSVPADGEIDARLPNGGAASRTVELMFLADASELKPEHFVITDGTENPPKIGKLATDGSVVRVTLEPGLAPGRWTTIKHRPSDSQVRIGRLPGDVTNDGVTDARDVQLLVEALVGDQKLPLYRTDMNGDGVLRPADLMALLDYVSPGFSKREAAQKLRP